MLQGDEIYFFASHLRGAADGCSKGMKKSALVLALIAVPASYVFADSSVSPAVMAMSDLKIKVLVFLGCVLVGAFFGAVLARRMSKKNRMLRDLTFSLSVLTGSLVGVLFFLR